MTQEALKLVLEALEEAWYHVGTFQPTERAIDLYDEARTAIKEALAQPEQKPVAWRSLGKMKNGLLGFRFATDRSTFHDDPDQQALCLCQSPQRPRVLFPTMLRKMWSGGEVQAWLDENVNKENT